MPSHPSRPRCGLRALLCLLAFGFSGTIFALDPVPTGQLATYPEWWFQRSVIPRSNPANLHPVWPADYPPVDDFAALNQGQLKKIATAAFDEIESDPAVGAGETFTKLVKSWYQTDLDGNVMTNPTTGAWLPKTVGVDNFAAVNLGQLKTVAAALYDRFMDLGLCPSYPWIFSSALSDDSAAANLGEAKNLFRFTLAWVDSDDDGIPDWFAAASGLNQLLAEEDAPPSAAMVASAAASVEPVVLDASQSGPNGGPITAKDFGLDPTDWPTGVTLWKRQDYSANDKTFAYPSYTPTYPPKYYLRQTEIHSESDFESDGTLVFRGAASAILDPANRQQVYRRNESASGSDFSGSVYVSDYYSESSQWPTRNRPTYYHTRHDLHRVQDNTGEQRENYDLDEQASFQPPADPFPTPAENFRRWLGTTFTPGSWVGRTSENHNGVANTSDFSGIFGASGPNRGEDYFFGYYDPVSPTHQQYTVIDPWTKIRFNRYLGKEYTTAALIRDTIANFPDYELNWRQVTPTDGDTLANWNLSADSDSLSMLKCRYKFHVKGVKPASLAWFEVFVPDAPDAQPQVALRRWIVPQDEDDFDSPIWELDPALRGANGLLRANGSYSLVSAAFVPDWNRDGKIDSQDFGMISEQSPWRWWVNDDSDTGDVTGDDTPGASSPNYADTIINGTRDLADWFPLSLQIGNLLNIFPTESYRYELRSSDDSVNVIVPTMGTVAIKLTESNSRAYLTNLSIAQSLAGPLAHVEPLTAGVVLSNEFLDVLKADGSGVILVEGRKRTNAGEISRLELHVIGKTSGLDLCRVDFPMKLSGVEQMYRQLNLRDSVSGLVGTKKDLAPITSMEAPANLPDASCSNKWNIFVIGSNVGGQSSRGWNSEMFKRHYQSGSKAKFVGVSWFGDPYYGDETEIWDYHYCIINAFRSAQALSNAVNALSPDGPKFIAGHSAGNVLIATAIQDYGMAITQFWMLDAAVAMEALDSSTTSESDMSQPEWASYSSRAWIWEFSRNAELPETDGRRGLTWSGRFADIIDKTYNFFSSSEDVLRRHVGGTGIPIDEAVVTAYTGGRFAWALQEKLKGKRFVIPTIGHGGSSYGGWGFSDAFHVGNEPTHSPSPTDAAGMDNRGLLSSPVFDPGYHYQFSPPPPDGQRKRIHEYAPDWILDLTDGSDSTASAVASANRMQLLAEMIPARTLPAGANYLPCLGDRGNFDMKDLFMTNPAKWPRAEVPLLGREWRHSDVKEMAYTHLYKLFDQMNELGGLGQ